MIEPVYQMRLQVSNSQNTHTISLIKTHQMYFFNSVMNFMKYKITSDSECTFLNLQKL